MQCVNDGTCVGRDALCGGAFTCTDGSDESAAACEQKCGRNYFKVCFFQYISIAIIQRRFSARTAAASRVIMCAMASLIVATNRIIT